MQEKEIISKLHELKQIKPSTNWVVSLKKQLIGEQPKISVFDVLSGMIFQRKLAYATISLVIMVVGVFGFAQYTVPGDLLFPMKKITEQSQSALLSLSDQSNYNLDIVNKRLGELAIIIKENKTNNIAPAVQEVKDGIAQAVKDISNSTNDFTNIATRVQKIQQTKREVETLGVIMLQESNNLNDALASLVENEIKVLSQLSDSETLTLEQEIRLVEVKAHYKKGEYMAALEKILLINGQ
ncbi:hypothetical protein KJ786_03590 [Patescibacteria group bacterium]|nr:hypothetical protein [Patescibacteria group bacterium]